MRETSLARMAWRNLWRNRRRTIITLSSIAFGLLLAVIATGLGDKSWTAPSLSHGKVFLRNHTEMVAYDLKD